MCSKGCGVGVDAVRKRCGSTLESYEGVEAVKKGVVWAKKEVSANRTILLLTKQESFVFPVGVLA